MTHRLALVRIAAIFLAFSLPLSAQQSDPAVARAFGFLEQLMTHKFAAANASLADVMVKELAEGGTEIVWREITRQLGEIRECAAPTVQKVQGVQVMSFPCSFPLAAIDVVIAVDDRTQVVGLWFRPGKKALDVAIPVKPAPAGIVESNAVVGLAPWALGASLTFPKKDFSGIGVVLVHGSGPHDRDETIGAAKPLRDIAHGLSERGIATLRYEKRTKQYPMQMRIAPRLTVQEETIDDALAAASLMEKEIAARYKGRSRAKSCVFIVGHSLGAYLAPRMAEQKPSLHGIIMLAPPASTLDVLILDQLAFLESIVFPDAVTAARNNAETKSAIANMRRIVADPAAAPQNIFGYSTRDAWPDLLRYSPFDTLNKLPTPALALFGSKDYQIPAREMRLWEDFAARHIELEVKSYEGLTHLFMESPGAPSPADYGRAGNVSPVVIQFMAEWLKAHC